MMHDCAVTERNVVFIDLPVIFDFELVDGGVPVPLEATLRRAARRDAARRRRRRRALVRHRALLRVPPAERVRRRTARVVLDVARHPQMFADGHRRSERAAADARPLDPRPAAGQGHRGPARRPAQRVPAPRRARIGRRIGSATPRRLADRARSTSARSSSTTSNGTTDAHDFGPGRMPGEPLFVPRAPRRGRGRRLGPPVVYDAPRDTSDVVILDAQDFTGARRDGHLPHASRSASTATGFRTAPPRRSRRAGARQAGVDIRRRLGTRSRTAGRPIA